MVSLARTSALSWCRALAQEVRYQGFPSGSCFAVCERRGRGTTRSWSDDNHGVVGLEDKEEGCQRVHIPERLDCLSYIVGIMEWESIFHSFIHVRQEDRKVEGRPWGGDAQTFWETNLARLPLFVPSQEGEIIFYKGWFRIQPKTAALEKVLLFSWLERKSRHIGLPKVSLVFLGWSHCSETQTSACLC